MSERKLRWGILGAAEIARKNWKAIQNSGNGTVVAVASRDLERSRRFVADCQAEVPFDPSPRALGRYDEIIALHEVDAVYIPLPTGVRKEWVLRAAEAGKHIVCEKPCGGNESDVREMVEACKRNRVQFMDGVMFVHSRRLERIRAILDDGESVGEIKRITSAFSFRGSEEFQSKNIRMQSALEPLGCLGDLGWYCVRFALWAMRWQMPRQVTGRILSQSGSPGSPAPLPTEFSGELLFDGGVSCGFYCSFLTDLQQWVNVSGTRGYLHVPDFVLPFSGDEAAFELHQAAYHIAGCDFNMEARSRRVTTPEYSHSHPTAQEANLFRNFAAQVLSGQLNELWPEMALKTQQVVNACLESAKSKDRTAYQ